MICAMCDIYKQTKVFHLLLFFISKLRMYFLKCWTVPLILTGQVIWIWLVPLVFNIMNMFDVEGPSARGLREPSDTGQHLSGLPTVHCYRHRRRAQGWRTLVGCGGGCTHSGMIPAQSLLPDGQSIIQQVGCLLIFVLIPDRRTETHKTSNTLRTSSSSSLYSGDVVEIVLLQFPQSMLQSSDITPHSLGGNKKPEHTIQ